LGVRAQEGRWNRLRCPKGQFVSDDANLQQESNMVPSRNEEDFVLRDRFTRLDPTMVFENGQGDQAGPLDFLRFGDCFHRAVAPDAKSGAFWSQIDLG